MAGIAIVAGSLLFIATSFRGKILDEAKVRIIATVRKGETFRQSPEQYLALLPRYYDRLVRLLVREGAGRVVLLGLTGVAISLAVRPVRSGRSFMWALPVVLVLDLFSFGRNYNPSIPAALDYPSHGAINFLRAQPGLFRVLALHGGLPPNTNVMYGLYEIRGYNALETDAFRRFLAAATGADAESLKPFGTLYFSNFKSRLIDLLNVRYVITEEELLHPKLSLAWEGGVRVYENRSVMPRTFLAYRTRVLSDRRDVERALRDPAFDPGAVVLLEEGPALSGPVDSAPTIRIIKYQPERVVIEASSRYDAVLVLADSWFPGWEATVDDAPATVLRADLFLRAVPIPAGHHQVIFRYNPLSFRLGAMVSGFTLVILVFLGLSRPLLANGDGQNLS